MLLAGLLALLLGVVQDQQPPLASLILSDRDVPRGYSPHAPLTGALDAERAGLAGSSEAFAESELPPGWIKSWRKPGAELRILALDLVSERTAARGVREVIKNEAEVDFKAVQGVEGAVGGLAAEESEDPTLRRTMITFARGTVLVVIGLSEHDETDTQVMSRAARLAQAQADRIEKRYTVQVPEPNTDTAHAAGALTATVVIYVLVVMALASSRDPLTGRQAFWALQSGWRAPAADGWVVDVSNDAVRRKKIATFHFLLELVAVGLILIAMLPGVTPVARVVLLALGGLMWLAATWYRWRRDPTPRGPLFARQRFVLSGAISVAALVLALVGLMSLGLGAQESQGSFSYMLAAGLLLAAAGLMHRGSQRLAAASAKRLLAHDARPMVLFLRSFGDDQLRLRSATLGRRSFLGRLSPNRFDSFEEVLARHLTAFGPVVAVNPPGTRLAPLGAARETLPPDSWRPVVDSWMGHAALVVICAPPGEPSPGLVWELHEITRQGLWARTVVVAPPLPADHLRWRWDAITQASNEAWRFPFELPVDPAGIMALTRRNGRWVAITAGLRDEWAYAAALQAVAALAEDVTVSAPSPS